MGGSSSKGAAEEERPRPSRGTQEVREGERPRVAAEGPSVGVREGDEVVFLSEGVLKALRRLLPPTVDKTELQLVYSTGKHGYNLNTLYRKSESFPLRFGAYCSDHWRLRHHPYGDFTSFLFRCFATEEGEIQAEKYAPTSHHGRFMFSNEEFLGLGGTRMDQFALGLNDKLSKGVSRRSRDFNNDPLSRETEFDVFRVELCMFVDPNESPYDDFGRPKNPKNTRPQGGKRGPAAEDQFLLDAAGITGHSHNFREEKVQFEEDEEGFDGEFHDSLKKLEPPLAEDIYKDRGRGRSKGAGDK